MLIYLSVFFGSLFLIVGMFLARFLYVKLHDGHVFHKLVTHKARKVDWHMKERIESVKNFLKYWNKRTFSLLVHYVIEKVEHYFHKATDFVRSKFPHHK